MKSGEKELNMGAQNTALFGIYRDRASVARAIEILRGAGFRNTDISALFPENEGTKDFALEKRTKAPEGTAAGAGTGAVVGGALGWLVGVGALAIPGLGPLLAAGPIVAALAGVGAGSVTGGLVGALIGFGMPEYEAKRYEGQIRRGSILISIHCDNPDWIKRAKHILRETGAEDIASAGEATAEFATSDRPMPRYATPKAEKLNDEPRQAPLAPRIADEQLSDTVELDRESLTKPLRGP
jgi:hypothetical protein